MTKQNFVHRSSFTVHRSIGLVACGLWLAAVFSSAVYAAEGLTVGVGEQKIVSIPAGSDITFTGPLHIARLDAGNVKIIGDDSGWGSVTVKHGDDIIQYSVTVVDVPPEQTIEKLKALLGTIPLTYSVGGGQVIVEGRIETTEDLARFNRAIDMYPSVVNLVVVTAKEPLVDIAVTLVEVEATSSTGFGILDIQPPTGEATMTGALPLGEINGGAIKENFQVGLSLSSQVLNALSAQIAGGRAKIIASPRIVTQNLKEAVITSGGEIPYRVIGTDGVEGVEYKPYGIKLTVTPEERTNDVVLHVNLESSEPVGTVSSASENPLTERSIDLNVAVEKDRTLVIAGLSDAVTSRDARGGCLFPLFAASTSVRNRELIVLLTPRMTLDGIQQDFFKIVTPKDIGK